MSNATRIGQQLAHAQELRTAESVTMRDGRSFHVGDRVRLLGSRFDTSGTGTVVGFAVNLGRTLIRVQLDDDALRSRADMPWAMREDGEFRGATFDPIRNNGVPAGSLEHLGSMEHGGVAERVMVLPQPNRCPCQGLIPEPYMTAQGTCCKCGTDLT